MRALVLIPLALLSSLSAQSLGALGGSERWLRDDATWELGGLGAEGRKLLESGLRARDAEIRLRCREMLGLNPHNVSRFLLEAEPAAVRALSSFNSGQAVLDKVARWGVHCRPILTAILADSLRNPLQREAIRILGRLGQAEDAPLLESCLLDAELGPNALWPLTSVRHELSPELESLLVRFKDHDKDWVRLRYWIVRGELGDAASFETALELAGEHIAAAEDVDAELWGRANRAWIYDLLDRHTEGLEDVELMLAQRPERASYLRRKASLLRGERRYDEALPCIEAALRNDPGDGYTMSLLGSCLHMAGRSREAIEHVFDAIDAGYEMYWAFNNLAWILATTEDPSLRDGETAVEWARFALSLKPGSPSIEGTLGEALWASGEYALAVTHLESSIARFEDFQSLRSAASERCFLTMCLVELGELDAARACLARVLEDDPGNPWLARAQLRLLGE